MIRYTERKHSVHGDCLFFDNGIVEVGVPLSFGIRVCHFSFLGEKNVFFEQPGDMTDLATPQGWRIRGGHRLWLAPEGADLYAPDNEPIFIERIDGGVRITQCEDTALHVIKEITLTLLGDSVCVTHRITNTGAEISRSLWAVTALAPGGVERIPLQVREGGYNPLYRLAVWDHTSLADVRAQYRKDEIILTNMPTDERYKIGVGHPDGSVSYELSWATFQKSYEIKENGRYPDGEVSFETFLCRYTTEIESLSPIYTLKAGESAFHTEVWRLCR